MKTEKIIDVFILQGTDEETAKNMMVMKDPLVSRVGVVGGNIRASKTWHQIANQTTAEYTMVYLSHQYIQMGPLSLERMVDVIEVTGAPLVYSDRWKRPAEGARKDAPVIDYQAGSLRDDFDFGSVLFLRTSSLKKAVTLMKADYQAAGLYDFRLKLTEEALPVRIPEFLYTEVELDARKTGERLFDYVDPRNRQSQIEMEQACTEYLKETGAFLDAPYPTLDFDKESFPVEATVMIPVRNRIRTIGDAIRSALAQVTTFSYNVFVVENGPECHSTDGTTELIDEIAATDAKLVHIVPTRDDLRVGGSWNTCIRDPRCGRFVVQLDSDDVYSGPDTLQKMVDTFREQQCAMVIGAYMLTDINLQPLPPGKIDHREWTDDNGRNNALRINGLGAPRAFFTPVVRQLMMPNVNYGEDYALGLAICRTWRIGRLYDVVYNCRRWDDNSDGDLDIDKENRNNLYKDRIRTWELLRRRALNAQTNK